MSELTAGAARISGLYPQRRLPDPGALERLLAPAIGLATRKARSRKGRRERIVEAIDEAGARLRDKSDAELGQMARELRPRLRSADSDMAAAASSFAVVRELAERTVGMRHYDVQMIGGWVMLEGMVAEMQTGEGKTLAATLPASTIALAGTPVHVVSVNDYLVARDAEQMRPLYEALGLTVGIIQEESQPDERREAYSKDITYVSNKQIAFDYLRDRITMGRHLNEIKLRVERLHSDSPRLDRLILPGLHFAIVDEIDSVLVDEARTPLIISRESDAPTDSVPYERALELVTHLAEGSDFEVDRRQRQVQLTERGSEQLADLVRHLGGVWKNPLYREELALQALSAQQLYLRDRHYLVADDRVQIVDEFTGRIMADRSWQRGLHQMLEVKEGCALSSEKETLARISYQKFFRRYLKLAGMTGTAREIAGELWAVYDLPVVTIPTRKTMRREPLPDRIFATREEKHAAVIERIRELNAIGRPVLVGTRSVAASEELSQQLQEAGIEHRVLNARNHEEEAEIVKEAGQPGRVTVATNMAGRGTDILLGPGVADLGGLHVIATEFHDARRIDRQLFGRCGRQGDPGSHEMIASLEDDIATQNGNDLTQLIGALSVAGGEGTTWLRSGLMRYFQTSVEARHTGIRRQLVKMDDRLSRALAFTGQPE